MSPYTGAMSSSGLTPMEAPAALRMSMVTLPAVTGFDRPSSSAMEMRLTPTSSVLFWG